MYRVGRSTTGFWYICMFRKVVCAELVDQLQDSGIFVCLGRWCVQSWQINYRILVYLYSAGLVQMDFTGYTSLTGGRGGGLIEGDRFLTGMDVL